MRRPLRLALLLSGVVAAVLSSPASAIAHPLGNFTVNRYAGIELAPGQVRIEYVLDMAEIPTVQVRPAIDTDADGTITDSERSGWAARTGLGLLANLTLTVDGRAVALDVVSSSMRRSRDLSGTPASSRSPTRTSPTASAGAR
jgi:nickel/cobalt exporter